VARLLLGGVAGKPRGTLGPRASGGVEDWGPLRSNLALASARRLVQKLLKEASGGRLCASTSDSRPGCNAARGFPCSITTKDPGELLASQALFRKTIYAAGFLRVFPSSQDLLKLASGATASK
jgi:hypothetical protein